MLQPILDAWLNTWINPGYGTIDYQKRMDAILELLATLKNEGFSWYGGEENRVRPFIIKNCVPKKPKKKTRQEWIEDVNLDISRAAGQVFASHVNWSKAKKMEQESGSDDAFDILAEPPRRGKPATLNRNRIDLWQQKFFTKKISLYDK